MARYKHSVYNDLEVANSDFTNIQPHIKQTIDSDNSDEVLINPAYNETTSENWFLDQYIAPRVRNLLKESQEISSREYVLTPTQKTAIDAYRMELWNLRSDISENGYTSMPARPDFLDAKLAALKSNGVM